MTETATACCCCNFAEQYEQKAHPAFRKLERCVLGCDYGGTSWTTREQADGISSALGLGDGVQMLELGSGTGWPSVYLAGRSGCRLTLLDLPINALSRARGRAAEEGLALSVDVVSASGAQLPFTSSSFDALGHSDVLCCLPEKPEMLEECRRVARDGARMLFYVISTGENLDEADMEEAIEAGPPHVETPDDYTALLIETGWRLLEREPVNNKYLQSLRLMVKGLEADAVTFIELMEPGEFQQALQRRRHQVSAVERGLLVREMFLVEAA